MKKLKHTSRLILGFLVVVAFALASCQKEDINLEHSNHTKVEPALKIVKLTNKDITQNKGVTNKLNFFTETLKTRQQNKTVYSSEYDFYINTDFATYIEKVNGSHSYTFPVQYANETGEINNLVLHSQEDGTYNALYMSYDVTEDEKVLISNGAPVDLEGKVSIGLINDATFIDSLFSKATTLEQCLIPMYSVGECDAGYSYIHEPEPFSTGGGMCSGSSYTLVNVSTDMDCLNSGETGSPGSGDGTSSTGDTGNPNGGGLNFDPNAPVTTPVTCEGCPEVDDECFVSDEDYNAPFSANSPFTVDLGEVRKSCDSISLPENEKFLCIYKKLTNSPSFKNLFTDTFGESENLNVKFKVTDNLMVANQSVNGSARRQSYVLDNAGQVESMDVLIEINGNLLSGDDVVTPFQISRTIIHECIHAYLYLKILNCSQGSNLALMEESTFEELIDLYFADSCSQNQEQHDFMINYLLPTMLQILSEIKDDFIPQDQQEYIEGYDFYELSEMTGGPLTDSTVFTWPSLYYYLSLSGLHETSAYNGIIPPNTISSYLSGVYLARLNTLGKNCTD